MRGNRHSTWRRCHNSMPDLRTTDGDSVVQGIEPGKIRTSFNVLENNRTRENCTDETTNVF